MPEYLEDPSVLTKDRLKSELLAHNVELPGGNPTKDVFVQLYLKNLTARNKTHGAPTLDAFSSDDELPPPVVSGRSRSSGRKAPRKTDRAQPDQLDVSVLSNEGLRDELLKHGVDAGPIVASTRKLYEKKLQKLVDDGPEQGPPPTLVLTQINHNGNSESDLYSDKEDEVTVEPEPEPEPNPTPEPEPTVVTEPEPAPVVEGPVRSRGGVAISSRTRSSQHSRVEKITASEQPPKAEETDVLKELFSNDNDVQGPTGIIATCRRPIRGAAGRPIRSSDLWNDQNCFSPKPSKSVSSFWSSAESRTTSRGSGLLPSPPSASSSALSSSSSSSSSRLLSAAPPAAPTKPGRRPVSVWVQLLLLAVTTAFLFFVYQAMETNNTNPFDTADAAGPSDATA